MRFESGVMANPKMPGDTASWCGCEPSTFIRQSADCVRSRVT